MRTSRRRFIAQLLGGLGALALPIGRYLRPATTVRAADRPATTVRVADGIQTSQWTESTAEFASGSLDGLVIDAVHGGLVLADGSNEGWYTSRVRQMGLHFNAVGSLWDFQVPDGAGIEVVVRLSPDGVSWSGWQYVSPAAHGRDDARYRSGELLLQTGTALQYRLRLYRTSSTVSSPRVMKMTWIGIDTLAGPSTRDLPARRPAAPLAPGVAAPPIISRIQWGGPSLGSSNDWPYPSNWPPVYSTPLKIIVHHTATSNDQDPMAAVRAIWYYQTYQDPWSGGVGWGDIGYNYLVDRNGNIYEGRYGGDGVVGGHALCFNSGSIGVAAIGTFTDVDVPAAMQAGLVSLLSWECYHHAIDPSASSFFVDRVLPDISGHRDLEGCTSVANCQMATECPGDYMYNRLPSVRSQTSSLMPSLADEWITQPGSVTMTAGQAANATITVRNRGLTTWPQGGPNPVHLGYRWYYPDGRQCLNVDDLRTPLPQDVPFGQTVVISGGGGPTVAAPRESGQFRLEWDLVQEYVAWFSDRGNPTLSWTVNVQAAGPQYGAQWVSNTVPSSMVAGQTAGVTVTVKNTSNFTWPAGGSNPVHLGYRWYRIDGSRYDSSDAPRSGLPNDVPPGQTVTISAQLTPPPEGGTFVVKWDLVYEGYAWFSDNGVPMYPVSVTVLGAVLAVSPTSLYFLIDGQTNPPTQFVQVTNAGSGQLTWQATSNRNWCTISASGSTAPSVLSVGVNSSGLSPGTQDTATIQIQSTSPGTQLSPQYVQVSLLYPSSPVRHLDIPLLYR